MIVELTVENLAIIERAQLTLGPGFTALTGETGAGKSLLVDALELALGERADTELVRHNTAKAAVSAVFDLSGQPQLQKKCQELGIELEDGLLYIQREVYAEGRSQCRIAGKLTPVSGLRQLGTTLVDLHGQHEHQSLLNADRHLSYLDLWIGDDATTLLARVQVAYDNAAKAREQLGALRASMRDRAQRLDLLKFQVNELEEADPQPREMEDLETTLSRLKHSEKLSQTALASLDILQEREGSAVEHLGSAIIALENNLALDPTLAQTLEPLKNALEHLQDGIHELSSYADSIDSDPQTLEDIAARIDLLRRLRRKYGQDEEAMIEHLENARQELNLLENAEASEDQLAAQAALAEEQLKDLCSELTEIRKAKAEHFSALVQAQLRDLAMDKALFSVQFQPKTPAADGADLAEFYFTANAGEPPRPLAKIASGGEISRVMLAIKTALAGRAGVPTLIFDEVDAGLSGRVAAVVGKKLEELAQHYQVLVITHSPQIAGRATTQYRIGKQEHGGRVTTSVHALNPEERVEEIAKMLAGEAVTDSAMASARELLAT
jgi:DNA repair protein RecN (Recombination protein N)